MPKKIYGDPEKAVREIVDKEFKAVKSVLDEALEHALRLLREAYDKSLREAEHSLRSEISRAEEQLKSVASSLDLELKSEAAALKSKYLEEALKRALERIREIKKTKVYEDFIVKVLSGLSKEEYPELVLRVAEDDMSLVQGLVGRLGMRNLTVSREPAPILGGIIAETPDGSVRLDYSLDFIIEMNKHRLLGAASKVLFPVE
ncbi:MAG: V-type ATP synthase subunit E [Desulfurococcales archaeon]|nr:V-type ATP synthase subunit E [Desulfurococcales archaeon]